MLVGIFMTSSTLEERMKYDRTDRKVETNSWQLPVTIVRQTFVGEPTAP